VGSNLTILLKELAERIKRQWGLRVEINLKYPEKQVPRIPAQDIYFIVNESLTNVARHAKASTVHTELAVEENRVHITVTDNGQGFPFRGRYDHVTFNKMNIGPVTLKERIASLGGSLTIDSSDTGTQLEIILPLTKDGA
jgi:signal transduction histidine kinase